MTKIQEVAVALLNYAKETSNDSSTKVTMGLSILAGPPGVICRIEHHTKDCVVAFLVPLTDYYTSKARNRHIMEVLPLIDIKREYDRLVGDAMAIGVGRENDA